jgi:MCM N-terminal domain
MCEIGETALQCADPAFIVSVCIDRPSARWQSCSSPSQLKQQQASHCCRTLQAIDNEDPVLNVDCANIASSDPTLYSHLLSCPTEVIPLMDTEARNLAAALGGDEADHHIQVRVAGAKTRNHWLTTVHLAVVYLRMAHTFAALLSDNAASLQSCGVYDVAVVLQQ